MSKTVLGIGAHYDDCIFGIPGILLKAVRKNYRVVILSLIGDYSNWRAVEGRGPQLVAGTRKLCQEVGVEIEFLNFAEMQFDYVTAAKTQVAEAVAKIRPDIAFFLWPHDHHADHEVASRLSSVALKHADRLLTPGTQYKAPRQLYWYDNGPRHTIDFEPNTYVDISDEWPQAAQWLGRLMALLRNVDYDPQRPEAAVRSKEILAEYRGLTCGVRYAEAVRALHLPAQEIL